LDAHFLEIQEARLSARGNDEAIVPDQPDSQAIAQSRRAGKFERIASRFGLFGKKEYLVIVEGDPLEPGLGAWFRLKIKQIVLPFYWQRTVHMHCLSRDRRDAAVEAVCRALNKNPEQWK